MSSLNQREIEFLRKPSKKGLSFALRNLDRTLPGFEWNSVSPDSCAIEVANKLWGENSYQRLGLNVDQHLEIFHYGQTNLIFRVLDMITLNQFGFDYKFWRKTSPKFVAKQLDRM